MSRRVFLILIGACVCVALVGYIFYSYAIQEQKRVRGSFTVTKNSITILSAPIPILRPHTHEVSDTEIDRVEDPGHGVFSGSGTFVVPFDMWVTAIDTVVEHAPESIIHHAVLLRQDRMDPVCPNRHEQVMVVGADSNPRLVLPTPYGIYLKKGTPLYLRNMVHNPDTPRGSGETYHDVSVGFRLTYERATSTSRSRPVAFYRIFIDDHPEYCSRPITDLSQLTDSFTVPASAGIYTRTTPAGTAGATGRFTISTPGIVVYLGAHTHPLDGGGTVSILQNNKTIGSFTPTFVGPESWVWRTPNEESNISVRSGDILTVQATYTNPHPLPITGAMGMGVILFSPDDPASLLK